MQGIYIPNFTKDYMQILYFFSTEKNCRFEGILEERID